jgi:Tfp pilus assembly protein PilF
VHRDLLLAPKSDPEELKRLHDGFRDALAQLFGHYTPIVIGYGGNDGSLMGFLKDLPPSTIPGGVYWCYWDGGDLPPVEIRQFVARQKGCLVPIPGFDEIMMLLGERIGFDVPDKYVLERADDRAKRIVTQVQTLKEKLKNSRHHIPNIDLSQRIDLPDRPDDGEEGTLLSHARQADILSHALSETMRRTSGPLRWWQWQERAEAATDKQERDQIYQEAIAALPDSHELLSNYALFLQEAQKDHRKSETYYVRALEANPGHTITLGNYALFLETISKNPDKAEAYYIRALEADHGNANAIGNYATFLHRIRHDPDKAERYYIRALEADPVHVNTLGNYAAFLHSIRNDPDRAEACYVQALEAHPEHASMLGNYAVFLQDIRKDPEKAERYYIRALGAEPGHANNHGNYVRFLLDRGRFDEGLSMLERALAIPEPDSPELAVELHMYAVCHRLPEAWRASLTSLKKLLMEEKITTGDWSFSGVIATAKSRGHPAAEWLEPLAAVCAGAAGSSTLDGWEDWKLA